MHADNCFFILIHISSRLDVYQGFGFNCGGRESSFRECQPRGSIISPKYGIRIVCSPFSLLGSGAARPTYLFVLLIASILAVYLTVWVVLHSAARRPCQHWHFDIAIIISSELLYIQQYIIILYLYLSASQMVYNFIVVIRTGVIG